MLFLILIPSDKSHFQGKLSTVSHPHKITSKIIVLIYKILERRQKRKDTEIKRLQI
jgi:hypothetical protein